MQLNLTTDWQVYATIHSLSRKREKGGEKARDEVVKGGKYHRLHTGLILLEPLPSNLSYQQSRLRTTFLKVFEKGEQKFP